jgi:hypothetical protein
MEGAKGLAFLREQKIPPIRGSGAPHEMHMDLGAQKGFHHTLSEIERLARLPEDRTVKTADRAPPESTRIQ